MTFDDIVRKRRSVRSFQSTPVTREDILAMGESARLAPSACNSQTWRFIAVSDPARIQRICDEAMRAGIRNPWLREAPLIIAGCSKLDLIANRFGRAISGIDYYRIDMGIAMEHIVLKATELGLGTCWIGWFNARKARRILGIPRGIRLLALLAVGYPKKSPPPRHDRKPLDEILYEEEWGRPFTTGQG